MLNKVIEASYPSTFHQDEAKILGRLLKNRHSVVLVGMRRVGISNFLRFFLNHPQIPEIYIKDGGCHLFIPVDLNDLVEREVGPFWTLTLKRIVDASDTCAALDAGTKDKIGGLFLYCIQTQDLFLTIDSVRKSLKLLTENGVLPTIFFVQFDRMKNAATPEFFANFQGLRDAVHQKLSYVFTSFRPLHSLTPEAFPRSARIAFFDDMFVRPLKIQDMRVVYHTYKDKYGLDIGREIEKRLFELVDGYVRFMHLALVFLSENPKFGIDGSGNLLEALLEDERISLQSEELWESLTLKEQNVVSKVALKRKISDPEDMRGYLFDTGFLRIQDGMVKIFSPLFEHMIAKKITAQSNNEEPSPELTKKEHIMFNLLLDNINSICERERIIEVVWPEVESIGVSDWAIDRLVARVRSKLKLQKSGYEIQTVKTRGYKLVQSPS